MTTIRRAGLAKDLGAISALIAEHDVGLIVVGWPLQPDGRTGPMTHRVDRLAQALTRRTGLSIERWDERMTTALAERALIAGGARRARRREVVDKVAATLILQSWLDARARRIATRGGPDTPHGDLD